MAPQVRTSLVRELQTKQLGGVRAANSRPPLNLAQQALNALVADFLRAVRYPPLSRTEA